MHLDLAAMRASPAHPGGPEPALHQLELVDALPDLQRWRSSVLGSCCEKGLRGELLQSLHRGQV